MASTLAVKHMAFDPSLPLEQARTIPSSWYTDPQLYETERRAVFNQSWQLVGRAEQVAAPGQFVTAEIAGEPILVIRGDDGVLRAVYNVCRHRAACVVNQSAGKVSRLRCRYHGWTYDLAGRLIGTPEFDGVADFRREDNGLVPVAVDTWGKWVWVHLGSNPPPLHNFLVPLSDQSGVLKLGSVHFVERREYELACNWKVFVDNYLDGGYHVNTVHPGLAGVLDYSQYRTEIAGNTAVQISPIVLDSSPQLNESSANQTSSGPTNPATKESQTLVSTVRPASTAYYWWVYPNVMINAYAGLADTSLVVLDTNLVLPLGPDRCRVIFEFYFSNPDELDAQFIANSIKVAEQIQYEDVGICEEVQRGLASQSYSTGRFSVRREAAGYHFHVLLARHMQNAAN